LNERSTTFSKGGREWNASPVSEAFVSNLDKLLEELRKEGVEVDDRIEEYEYGRFGWVMDPEGNRIELWEPPRRKS
jgi:predicted enzyme related to lactoylglutathione lyase